MQRLSLLFETIGVVPLDTRMLGHDELVRLRDELDFLAREGIVQRFGRYSSLPFVSVALAGANTVVARDMARSFDVPLDDPGNILFDGGGALWRAGQAENAVQMIARSLDFEGAPVAAYNKTDIAAVFDSNAIGPNAIQLLIHHFPVPPDNMPWETFLQFRRDSEHRHLLRKLRLWIQDRANSSSNLSIVSEELEVLLVEYKNYMKLQHGKYGEGTLSTILIAGTEALEEVGNFKFGSAIRAIFDIRSKRLALTEAEMLAPGRELSYMVKVDRLLADGA